MTFTFLNMAGEVLFLRDDAERAEWTQEEMTLNADFPFVPGMEIATGQRIFFVDPSTGAQQVYEVKQAKTLEPDSVQQVVAECICISELSDEHIDKVSIIGVPPQMALETVLHGTLWAVGNVDVGNIAVQDRIKQEIAALGLNGNVDLTSRPIIYPDKMKAAGYTDFDGDYATLYSTTYTEKIKSGANYTLLMTPIQQNGTVYSAEYLDKYVSGLCDNAQTIEALKASDSLGLLMHYLPGTQISEMDLIAEEAHDLSDEWEQTNESVRSSVEVSRGSVWQAVLQIKDNFNVYIEPRVVVSSNGTISRFLDIKSTEGEWNGVLLSVDKNFLDPSVTLDDSEVATALYGYGGTIIAQAQGQENTEVNFADIVWEAEDGHPAKPSGQMYIEDPAATAEYGRNGRARFGFYQNTDISDPEILLQKTWEALQTSSSPAVSIEGSVADLYRMGYADQPIKLHDIALVEILPAGFKKQLQIIRITTDLLDPSSTVVTIGSYIPNIIYIDRDTNEQVTGSRGGGSKNKSNETQRQEFESKIEAVEGGLRIRAYQNDLDDMDAEVKRQEARITVVYNKIEEEVVDRRNADEELAGRITITANRITAEVTRAQGAEEVLAGRLTITESQISQEVTDRTNADATLSGRITTEANRITAEVTRAEGAEEVLAGRLTITENAITQEVTDRTNADNTLSGRITTEAGRITAEVTRAQGAEETLAGRLTITENAITQEVTDRTNADSTLSGRITTESNKISLVVEEKDGQNVIRAASIVTAVNNEGSTVAIDADHVSITGNTKLSGCLTIDNGDLLVKKTAIFQGNLTLQTAGSYVQAPNLNVASGGHLRLIGTQSGEYYDLTAASIQNYIKNAEVDGNILKLWKVTDSTTPSITFSKATTLSGAWSGSDYIVTASPQGNTFIVPMPLRLNGTSAASNFSAEITDPTGQTAKKSVFGYLIFVEDSSNCYVDVNTQSDGQGSIVARIDVKGDTYDAGYNSAKISGSWSGNTFSFAKATSGVDSGSFSVTARFNSASGVGYIIEAAKIEGGSTTSIGSSSTAIKLGRNSNTIEIQNAASSTKINDTPTYSLTSHTNCVAGLTRAMVNGNLIHDKLYYRDGTIYKEVTGDIQYWYYKDSNSALTTYYS